MKISRTHLLKHTSPLIELPRLQTQLQCVPRIFMKCDHTAPFGGAGNKLRKLEYLVAEAQELGADTLVTTGGLQSNHARLTAAVAAKLGMRCELLLKRIVPNQTNAYEHNGNILLMHNFDARIHILNANANLATHLAHLINRLRNQGRKPYCIPFGGSSVIGSLGYVACAQEIQGQLQDLDLSADTIFCATGSGGTQAGLLAGFVATETKTKVRGISVLYQPKNIISKITGLTNGVLMLLGYQPLRNPVSQISIAADFIGADGYGVPTKEGIAAVRKLGKTEGIALDPVYTGKAFAGMLHALKSEYWRADSVVVFVHTGGIPGLYAYPDSFTSPMRNIHDNTPIAQDDNGINVDVGHDDYVVT